MYILLSFSLYIYIYIFHNYIFNSKSASCAFSSSKLSGRCTWVPKYGWDWDCHYEIRNTHTIFDKLSGFAHQECHFWAWWGTSQCCRTSAETTFRCITTQDWWWTIPNIEMQLGNFQNLLDLQLSPFLPESATRVATLWGLELCHNLKIICWRLVEGRPDTRKRS